MIPSSSPPGKPLRFPRVRAMLDPLRAAKLSVADLLAMLCVIVFVVMRLSYFLQGVYVPDERGQSTMMHHLITQNEEAFGAGYWVLGHLVALISSGTLFSGEAFLPGGPTVVALRLLSFLSIVYAIGVMWRIARKHNSAHASWVLIAFLSTPVVWFGGKLITGEFYQIGFMALAAWMMFYRERRPWWVVGLLGFVIGMKMSAAPAVAFLLLVSFFQIERRDLRARRTYIDGLKLVLWLALGFILCSPNVIYDPAGYRAHMLTNALHPPTVGIGLYFLDMQFTAWDYVQVYGVFYTFFSLISLIAFALYLICFRAWRLLAFSAICFATLIGLIYVNNTFFPWHTFACIYLIWVGLALVRPEAAWERLPRFVPLALLTVCMLGNIAVIVPMVRQDMKSRNLFVNYVRNTELYDDCLANALRSYPDRAPVTVICHESYLFDGHDRHFCHVPRLRDAFQPVAEARKHPLEVRNIFVAMLANKDFDLLKQLLDHGSTIISLVNTRMVRIFTPPQREDEYMQIMLNEAREKHGFPINERSVGRCGDYEMIEYSAGKKP